MSIYKRTLQLIIGSAAMTVPFLFAAHFASAGPLRVLSSNPRYFTDGSGKAIYLTGSATHRNFKDWGYSDPPPVFDYNGYLDFLKKHNHNFIRLWTVDVTQFVRLNDSSGRQDTAYVSPFPWHRTGPGTAQDGKPKFDLSQFDQSYFDRLRQRVADAGARGIYVSIMLFEGNLPYSSASALAGHPFNGANNINGINVDRDGGGYATEAYTLDDPSITAIQDAYVEKVIDSVRDLDNVLFEICNECNPGAVQWQYHMIDLVHSYDGNRHPVGMSSDYGSNYEALNASNADWIAPPQSPSYDNLNDPMPATGQKVVIADADHICYENCYAGMIWKQFLRGDNTVFVDLAPPFRDKAPLPEQELIRSTMGYTKTYADKMNLAAMTPRRDLASTGYALANPGSEYLVYAPGGGSFTVSLPAGAYDYEWFNPTTGQVAQTSSVSAPGGGQSFTPPFGGDAVLYLSATRGKIAAPTGCTNFWNSSADAPSGFGAAYNVLSSAFELLIDVSCSGNSESVSIGNGSQYQYLNNQGYHWTGSSWAPYAYSCPNLVYDTWCVGNASTNLSLDAAQKQSILAYICNWTGTEWKCGCHDSACTTNYWNLQQFKQ